MMRKIILTAVILATAASLNAQDVLEQINEIKLNPQYAYGEATHEHEDSAFTAAVYDLIVNLENKLKQEVNEKIIEKKAKKLSRTRGSKVRVLAYLRMDEINTAPQVSLTPDNTTQQARPQNQQTSSMTESVNTSQVMPPATNPAKQAIIASLVTDLMATEDIQSAVNILDTRKRDGSISAWTPYSKTKQPEEMHLLIFDKQYNIPVTVLSPQKANGKRDNLITNKEDSLDNYKEKLAVCFKLIEN